MRDPKRDIRPDALTMDDPDLAELLRIMRDEGELNLDGIQLERPREKADGVAEPLPRIPQ
ncbi:hypothetical protein HY629_01250 [Candidatus Uhrbacteria bacterium]|nr:hypothetical protein [Candidatus Uhrbacteria bacterium]